MRRRALLQTIGTTAIAALAGCSGNFLDGRSSRSSTDSDGAESTTTTQAPDAGSPLDLRDHELVRTNADSSNELVKVAGTLVNQSESTIAQATVNASFFDETDSVLAESSADVTDLQSEETWSFELTFPGAGAEARQVTDYSLSLSE